MTGPGTNTYIYGIKELAVIDAGPALPEHVQAILAAQEALNAPITTLIASHTHSDHSPAIAEVASQLDNPLLIGIPAATHQKFEDLTFKPHHKPQDDEVIELEAGPVRAIHTPGHVGNHVCYLIEEHQMLTTGDHLMNGSTVVIVPPKGSMKDYIESLQKLQNYPIKVMAPGHGALIENPQQVVEWTIDHRLQREAKVVANLGEDPATLSQLVRSVYDDVDKSMHSIAEYSLHAHLIKLAQEGRAAESELGWHLI
ncbi:MAG: MBL fold metallo-hydrolase [Gammaproteobacteria bacterium]|nr:MBL fold metallo-hydrolase [Gammaproteobacteria bacterium]